MEFKRLSDVEVVAEPTESANVLIEENGVIKKAPKTAIGGAGGGEIPDMVITVSGGVGVEVNSANTVVTSGSVSNVLDAIRAGRQPSVKVRFWSGGDSDYSSARAETYVPSVSSYGESVYLYFDIFGGNAIYCYSVQVAGDDSISWYNLINVT